jgi:hypothetical protein
MAANQGECPEEQAEWAAGCADPIAESLWPHGPEFPAGPFGWRSVQGSSASKELVNHSPRLQRDPCVLQATSRGAFPGGRSFLPG